MDQAEVFRALKPVCVSLSDEALKIRSGKSSARNIVSCAEDLLRVLESITSSGGRINQRLVNYVFFPLSHLFKEKDKFPVRSLELALQCLQILLQTGWRAIEDSNTGLQLLIMLTLLAQNNHQSHGSTPQSNELTVAALNCASELFQSLEPPPGRTSILFDTASVPAVGHAIKVTLDQMKYGASTDVQLSALAALDKFCKYVASREVLQNFLPGIFSALSFVLTPNTKARRSYRVLGNSLAVLDYTIRHVLSDPDTGGSAGMETNAQTNPDEAWVRGTAAQTKLVLANVIRLKKHDRSEVRVALLNLCWTVIERCHNNLSDSVPMMVETVVALSRAGEDNQYLRLQSLINSHPTIGEYAKSSVYEALISLPRIMQSNDDEAKDEAIKQVVGLVQVLDAADIDITVIEDLIYRNLRGTFVTTTGTAGNIQSDATAQPAVAILGDDSGFVYEMPVFESIDSSDETTQRSMDRLHDLIRVLSEGKGALSFANRALENAYDRSEQMRHVDLSICLGILKGWARVNRLQKGSLNASMDYEQVNALRNDLFDIAVSFLHWVDTESDFDWRIQAISLDILAFQAEQTKQHFRAELSDVLYPVVCLLGSTSASLRSHAGRCLDAMALACKYSDAKQMLVANVDYLVNAIGLQLNALDISPQSCQVLLMMTSLCGPLLIPYLDDLVDKIFDALECFHGYSVLVERLFAVLERVVVEGAKTLPITSSASSKLSHQKESVQAHNIETLKKQLYFGERAACDTTVESREIHSPTTPQEPWSTVPGGNNKMSPRDSVQHEERMQIGADNEMEDSRLPSPTPTKVYKIIQRIALLTQHHLPSSSAAIRGLLVSLLARAIPFLSQHEDSFLPLIHTLWPILLPRLGEKEAFVVAGVLDVMANLCVGSGDFLSTRVVELWPTIHNLYLRCRKSAIRASDPSNQIQSGVESPKQGALPLKFHSASLESSISQRISLRAELGDNTETNRRAITHQSASQNASNQPAYTPTTTRLIFDALINFIIQLVAHVRISEGMYMIILSEFLSPQLISGKRQEMRSALMNINPDAVHLLEEKEKLANCSENSESTCKTSWREMRRPKDIPSGPRFLEHFR